MHPVITLTTDFGTRDGYVGAMKGVLLSICPAAHLVDITHEIAPQDILAAALVVQSSTAYFPPGTVHLVVVDPGVGSTRRPLALATPQGVYVGPDNGIFFPIWQQARADQTAGRVQAVLLDEPRFWRTEVSATFHGRDIFAPAAAHLAAGTPVQMLGSALSDLVALDIPRPIWQDSLHLLGSVISIDHFGNCISNITADDLARLGPLAELRVRVGAHELAIEQTYARVAPGAALALLNSSQQLEIAVRDGHASRALGIARGAAVQVNRPAAALLRTNDTG